MYFSKLLLAFLNFFCQMCISQIVSLVAPARKPRPLNNHPKVVARHGEQGKPARWRKLHHFRQPAFALLANYIEWIFLKYLFSNQVILFCMKMQLSYCHTFNENFAAVYRMQATQYVGYIEHHWFCGQLLLLKYVFLHIQENVIFFCNTDPFVLVLITLCRGGTITLVLWSEMTTPL